MSAVKHKEKHSRSLVVNGLVKRFDQRAVLSDVYLEVQASDSIAILGTNGTGKSTLLRCVIGELHKDQGRICICGADLDLDPLTAKINLGYAADDPFLYPYLTGREHIQLWGAFRKIGASSLNFAWELADLLALQEALTSQVRTYSRGMRQKLSLIGALFHRPGLILLDEPFTAMDQDSTATAIMLLRSAQSDGASIVFTSHQQDIVQRLVTSMVYLHNGTLTLDASVLPAKQSN